MGRANIEKLIGMLTGEGRPRFPRRTAAADLAVGRVERDGLSSFQDFMDVCTCCCAHLIPGTDSRRPQNKEMAESTVRRILAKAYPGGVDAAYLAAQTGVSGGILDIVDLLQRTLALEGEDLYFLYALEECVDTSDLNDVLSLVTQHLERYGHALFGTAVPPPAILVPKFKELIREHVAFILSMHGKYAARHVAKAISGDRSAAQQQELPLDANTAASPEHGKDSRHA